jgi:hypothetical protein
MYITVKITFLNKHAHTNVCVHTMYFYGNVNRAMKTEKF